MTIATYADLKSQVATFLNRSNLTTQIPTLVQLAETRIAYGSREGALQCEPLRIRSMETSADVTISAQTAALPTGYLQSRRLYLNSNPVAELNYVVPDVFWKLYAWQGSAQPTHFTVEGENFVFGPTPDSTYTGKSLYYKKFTPLSADLDTNWLLTNAPAVYLHGTLMEAYRFVRNMEKAMDEHSAFIGAVNALNLSDKADRYSGSPWQAVSDTGNP